MSRASLDTAAPAPAGAGPEGTALDARSLAASYGCGETSLREVVDEVGARIDGRGRDHVWISRVPWGDILARVRRLEELRARSGGRPALPLWGVPFAVKDNIDVAGLVTTAACPTFAYTATRSAPAVQRLLDAGAILVGKTNMDQFATGLTGTRSPYGPCESVFGGGLISGGSSSGSAVAVAAGLVSFSLGTDTAGSGRVPAALNGIVGLKPTRGLIPTTGVVPACRSLDCVSVFATTVADASAVLAVARGYDPSDPYSRSPMASPTPPPPTLRVGVADPAGLDFFGDTAMQTGYQNALAGYAALADRVVTVEIGPLVEAGDLLYGPWLAERYADLAPFVSAHPDAVLPITRSILEGGRRWSGAEVFAAAHRLEGLRRWAADLWRTIDVLVLPTVGTTFTIAEIEAQPVERNRVLGRYTQFANLLDTAALAVPGGMTAEGRPVGVTLVGPAHSDALLAHVATPSPPGEGRGLAPARRPSGAAPDEPLHPPTLIAVVGRHLSGESRNGDLLAQNATLAETTLTAPLYRLYRIGQGGDSIAGLLRSGAGGASIEVELWQLPSTNVEPFLRGTRSPLGLGWLELADGRTVLGFLCEAYGTDGAEDITASGGWRAHLLSRTPDPPQTPDPVPTPEEP